MYNGKAAEGELRQLAELSGGTHLDNDLVRHNLVVFRGGENALQVRHHLQPTTLEAATAHGRLLRARKPCRSVPAASSAAWRRLGLCGDALCACVLCLLQYLPPMGDMPAEARLNLVIHHLRHNEVGEAFNLVKELEPTSPQEYILKGVVHACIGQNNKGSTDHLKTAQQYFQLVRADTHGLLCRRGGAEARVAAAAVPGPRVAGRC